MDDEQMITIRLKAKSAKLALEWLYGGSGEYNLEYTPDILEASYDLYKAIKETGTDVDVPGNLNEEDLEDDDI